MGSVVGPDSSVIGFHGDGPVRRGFDNLTVITQRFGELDPGKMRAEAVVDTAAKRQHRGCAFPGDVEPIGVVVGGRITVGCSGIGDDERARRKQHTAGFDVDDGLAQYPEVHR